tara:strand:+ start:2420 stop:2902 length:483 start_codon:yes stop_codon:yes gene_type:complete
VVKRSEQKWETKALSSIESPALAQALEYWRSLCDGPGFPGRKQLDPMEMRSYLPKILLICINDDGDFYYRLCGTEIARFNGADVTGKKVGSDSVGKGWRHLIHYYKKPLKTRAPVLFNGSIWWQDREYVSFEQILLPLAEDHASIDCLMSVIEFSQQSKI